MNEVSGFKISFCLIFVLLFETNNGKIFFNTKKIASILQYKPCDDTPKDAWKTFLTLNKFNRTMTVVDANLTMTEDFDDSLFIELEVKRWGDGGWKNNFIKFEKSNACSTFLIAFGSIAKTMLEGAGIKLKCPVPKNIYTIKNTYIDMSKNSFILFGGKYWARFKLKTGNNKIKLCTDTILQIDELI